MLQMIRGINAVRERVSYEAKKYVSEIKKPDGTIIPAFKIIILDEADSMTAEAQDALRVPIEESSTVTRFCFRSVIILVNYRCYLNLDVRRFFLKN